MFCTNCGHEIKEGALFCTECGTPAPKIAPVEEKKQEPNAPTPQQEGPKKKNNVLLIVLIALLAVLVVLVGAYFVVSSDIIDIDGIFSSSDEEDEEDDDDEEDVDEEDEDNDDEEEVVEEETEEPTEVEETSEYILPNSDKQYLTEEDLEGLTAEELRIARNEIFARHGRIFASEDLNEYFNSKDWYTPMIEAEDFDDEAMLNEYEKVNATFIREYEEEMGY